MSRPQISEHNAETGEYIIRDMTDVELDQHEKDLIEWAAAEQSRLNKIEARKALFERLGITAEEAELLLS